MKLVHVALIALPLLTGCVSKGKYDQALTKTRITQAELAKKTDASNAQLAKERAETEKQRAEITRLESLIIGLSVSSQADRASNEARVALLNKRLNELRAARAAADTRAAIFKELTLRLAQQIDAGELDVVLRDGRMVLELPNDVLFDTGRTEIKSEAKGALDAIADVMKEYPDRQFQVAGHTDNVPIHTDRFATNWELSSGRALRVVHFLIARGVSPGMLSAAGYGEIDPVASNDRSDGRKLNRRTEITLQPNIDELVDLVH